MFLRCKVTGWCSTYCSLAVSLKTTEDEETKGSAGSDRGEADESPELKLNENTYSTKGNTAELAYKIRRLEQSFSHKQISVFMQT